MTKKFSFAGGLLAFLALQVSGGKEVISLPQFKEIRPQAPLSGLQVNREFGRMPVYFIPNRGQMDERVAYYVQGKDKTVYFTDEGVTFALGRAKKNDEASNNRRSARRPKDMDERALIRLHSWEAKEGSHKDPGKSERENGLERWVVKLDFVGANPEAHPEGLEETGTKISYFRGKPEEWKAGLPACSKVMYRDLWPGIDLVYYGTVNRLKYEFIVHPGADPSQIRLSYRGAESVSVDDEGRLQVKTPIGGFSDDVPIAYQEIAGKIIDIKLAYKLDGDSTGQGKGRASHGSAAIGLRHDVLRTRSASHGFEVGEYDRRLPLILDPAVLIYCGYIGGNQFDTGNGIAVDSAGCAYVTGMTYSNQSTFPAKVGPDLTLCAVDAFVAKVNAAGTEFLYCGFIGGCGPGWDDSGYGIAVDNAGYAYVTGYTQSLYSLPAIIGPDLTFNGGLRDAFVAKVNAEGTALDYCGYIGGSDYDEGRGIAVDGAGSAYVIGWTGSSEASFPVTVGPDLTYNGDRGLSNEGDVFVAKVNSAGIALDYCGYIGGNNGDWGHGIAVDNAGCAYVTGGTYSSTDTFPLIVGPDLTYNGGGSDAFVAKVNAAGTALDFCGYIGGGKRDGGYGIAVDRFGCSYVTGYTRSNQSTFPVTPRPDRTYNGHTDAFAAKIDASGTRLLYCGYLGGTKEDTGYGIAVDSACCAYVTGYTRSSEASFPVTIGPSVHFTGWGAAFVAKVNPAGTALHYCGYIGGSGSDYGYGIAVDIAGYAYVTGKTYTRESAFPVTMGPDLTFNGWGDAFVTKIGLTPPEYFPYYVFDGHDFNGDGASDIAVWRPSDGFWYIRGFDNDRWGQFNDIPVPGDYNGDGFTDLAIWRPSDGFWYIRGIDNDRLGQVGDVPVPKDYDGDGRTDLAIWRPSDGTWHIRYRTGGGKTKPWGQTGDYPVPADYDGDGLPDLAVWRSSTGFWYIKGVDTDRLGHDGDIPVPADYDGDGKTDPAVWRPSDGTWHIRYRAERGEVKPWGMPGDVPVPGDYNGDGVADIAVWRPSTGQWLIRKIDTVRWGAPSDIPLVR